MFDSYRKGEIGKLKVQLRATELGFLVSIPAVEGRYDLVFDDGKRMYRVQVKYCDKRSTEGSVELDLRKQCRGQGKRKAYTGGEIDVVVVYLPVTNKCYWFDTGQFDGVKSLTIRFDTPKNGRSKGLRFAKDFEF